MITFFDEETKMSDFFYQLSRSQSPGLCPRSFVEPCEQPAHDLFLGLLRPDTTNPRFNLDRPRTCLQTTDRENGNINLIATSINLGCKRHAGNLHELCGVEAPDARDSTKISIS